MTATRTSMPRTIWMLWLQGWHAAPYLVRLVRERGEPSELVVRDATDQEDDVAVQRHEMRAHEARA